MKALSVILITRNQEWNVARLIQSVLAEVEGLPSWEICLVDSASSDKTIEIASQFPISVLQLEANQPLSAAAGRYTGCLHTTGKLVLFLDGDMALCPGWLVKAMNLLTERSDAGVVDGVVIDRPIASNDPPRISPPSESAPQPPKEIYYVGGTALYSRNVLDEVKSFNPYLISDEEPELCLRIRNAGYKVLHVNIPIAYHYTYPIEEISTLINRWRRGLWQGMGQSMRYHVGTGLFWSYVARRGYGCVPAIAFLAGIVCLSWSWLSGQALWIGLWFALVVGIVCVYGVRKRSLYGTVYSILARLITLESVIRGFLRHPEPPENYPARVLIHKVAKTQKRPAGVVDGELSG